ncbi:MAG: SRPBCC domain-containing protein [Acidimicrobiales bacterium]
MTIEQSAVEVSATEQGIGNDPEDEYAGTRSFTTSFMVDQTPGVAFAAINNVRAWWSGEIDGDTDKLGDEFTYRYEDVHFSKQRITELVPDKKVVWLVEDSFLSFVKDTTEWNETEITFDISTKGGQTEIRFTHRGLVPTIECFNDCSNAWGFYVHESLQSLITTGMGRPNE